MMPSVVSPSSKSMNLKHIGSILDVTPISSQTLKMGLTPKQTVSFSNLKTTASLNSDQNLQFKK